MLLPAGMKGLGLGLILASAVGLWSQARASNHDTSARATLAGARPPQQSLGGVRFEANRGQFDSSVRYLARGKGYGLYLTPEGPSLLLVRDAVEGAKPAAEQALVTMRLVGGRAVEPAGAGELPGPSNYFVGRDPSKWRTGVPNFGRVIYPSVLPGVDIVYYGTGSNELEFDLRLGPGTDPQSIELAFEGVTSVELDASGNAILNLAGGAALRQRRPIAYQTSASGARLPVQSSYELRAPGRLGFSVRGHDPTRPLVIDPILTYGTFLGAGNYDELSGVATDAAGNTYVVGHTTGGLFPTSTPQQPVYAGGASDAVVCKINAAGTGFVYSTYLGGSNADQAYAVAADASGGAYVVGVTHSTNFPTAGAYQPAHAGPAFADGFVTKLNANGSALGYSTYLGGAADDFARGVAVGPSGNAYVAGVTFSAGFPLASAFQAGLSGFSDAFVTQLAPAGSPLLYSTFLGGSSTEYGNAIAIAPTGEAFVVGSTDSNNFPTASALQPSRSGGTDAFVSKLNASGNGLAFSTYLGGTFTDNAYGVTESNGEAVVVGSTTSNNFPTAAATQPGLASAGVTDAFVSRLSGPGTALVFSTYLGGSAADTANAVAVDSLKNVYVVGNTASTSFPLLAPLADQASYGGGAWDGFFAAYRANGQQAFSTYLGGDFEDRASGVAVHTGPDVHIAVSTQSPDFPTASPLPNLGTLRGSQDGFVLRSPLLNNPSAVPAATALTALFCSGLLLGMGVLLLSWLGAREKSLLDSRS